MKAIPVAGYLMKDHNITDEMQQQLQFEKTTYARNRKLLSIILRRGPKGFNELKRALLKASQNNLAKLLKNEDSELSEYEKKNCHFHGLFLSIPLRKDRKTLIRISHMFNPNSPKKYDVKPIWTTSVNSISQLFHTKMKS